MSAAVSRPTTAEAKAYVDGLEMFGVRLGLDRVRALAGALGDPQKAYRTIHVVGTNGKSSTTRFAANILREYGHRVGAYVSPHLVSLAERQLVDGAPATEEEFYELVAEVMPVAERINSDLPDGEVITQFELLTAVAFLFFQRKGCDVVVVEAGLGGRWDATSIISSEVQVVTTIGREHSELLGETPLAILEEKAAVIPEGGRVVAGLLDKPVRTRLREICEERGARLALLDEQISLLVDVHGDTFDVFGLHDLYSGLKLSVLGEYQKNNAAVAVGAVEMFLGEALDVGKVRRGLEFTQIPGRLELISEKPLCVLDGAHNPAGMAELMRSLDRLLDRRRLLAVVSILRDKGAVEMLRDLAPRCDIVFVTRNSNPRAYEPEELAALLSEIEHGPEVFIDADPASALRSAYNLATSNQVVLVTGSLYLVADVKRALG
ncbi:MAG: folylpolyglutamate synthase/dihydrofolate synthase family protein [Thermoleophilia bacterium]